MCLLKSLKFKCSNLPYLKVWQRLNEHFWGLFRVYIVSRCDSGQNFNKQRGHFRPVTNKIEGDPGVFSVIFLFKCSSDSKTFG